MSYQVTKWHGVILMHFPKWRKTVWKSYILYNSDDMLQQKMPLKMLKRWMVALGPGAGKGLNR